VKVPVPYIAHYFPDAKIVPIIFTSGLTEKQIDQFVSALVENIDEKTIVIGSLDFSHYLPSVMTAEKDVVTLAAIEQRNYPVITNFSNDNIDSAVTLSAFLKTMDLIKANNLEVLQHHNSADFIGREINSSTSYFTLFFY
jgi:AmmeMemoRadiSam system protein B